MNSPTFISFFSGIEGFRLGLEASGWRCIHSVEIDEFCGKVQEARYGHRPQSTDIRKVKARDLPDADLWVAGWPCQGLSVAGRRKGLADERSGLFWEFVRLLEQKRPPGLACENVPGLLTTCSCALCSTYKCGDCKKKVVPPIEEEDWEFVCEACGSKDLVGGVLPAHRGTDFFVVLSSLQRVGYGVQTRILDAQFFGVPQRRNRIFFSGRIGAPCRPEVLFEPEGGGWDSPPGSEEGKISAGELARNLGAVGGGNDYGANKGTLVKPGVASPITAGTHPGFQDRGDGLDNIVAKSITASAGHHGHSSPRGDGSDNLVASPLLSPAGGQRTTDIQTLITSSDKAHAVSKGTGGGLGGRDGQDDYVIRIDQTKADPVVKTPGVTDSVATGTGHGGYANQAIARHEAPIPIDLRQTSRGDNMKNDRTSGGPPGTGIGKPGDPTNTVTSRKSAVAIPSIAAPLTAGSSPNSNMPGRHHEDDVNLVVSENGGDIQAMENLAPPLRDPRAQTKTGVMVPAPEAESFQSRYYTRGGKAGRLRSFGLRVQVPRLTEIQVDRKCSGYARNPLDR